MTVVVLHDDAHNWSLTRLPSSTLRLYILPSLGEVLHESLWL